MSGQCKLCVHWLEASGIFPIRTRDETPKTRALQYAPNPNPFYLVPLWPQEFRKLCSQCRPIFAKKGGEAAAVASKSPDAEAEAPHEITSINFHLIFIFISYFSRKRYFFDAKICFILSDVCQDLWTRHHFELIKINQSSCCTYRQKTEEKTKETQPKIN